ncbi:MAG: hypothetical protein ACTSUJ_07210 [Candidatus Njordarchaeales archaeon]
MGFRERLWRFLSDQKKNRLEDIIENFLKRNSASISGVLLAIRDGFLVHRTKNIPEEQAFAFIRHVLNAVKKVINLSSFDGRFISRIVINGNVHAIVGYDYELLIILPSHSKMNFEDIKRKLNELLDKLGELL